MDGSYACSCTEEKPIKGQDYLVHNKIANTNSDILPGGRVSTTIQGYHNCNQ
jgi:hypothetical protein